MTAFVYTDAFVSINGVDLSDHVLSASLNYAADLQEDTAMGDTTRTRIPGLLDWSLEVTFKQDFAGSNVDATLFTLVGAAAFAVIIRPDKSDSITATNPNFTGNAVLESYPPLGGGVGDLAQATAVFQSAGALSRAVS